LQTLTFDDVTDRLSAPEDPGLFGLFHERVSGGQGVIGKGQCEGPYERALSYKVLQKYKNMSRKVVFQKWR
jgi:hypothetical protein